MIRQYIVLNSERAPGKSATWGRDSVNRKHLYPDAALQRAGVGGAPTTSALRIRDLFVGAGDLDTVDFAGLRADLR